MHMKHNGASKTLLLLIDGVFPISDLLQCKLLRKNVNCYGGDNKAAALSPGAAHDRRAASERYTESTDEIGSAARRGARSGWRPFMMNEAGVGTPSLPLFCLVFACAKNLSGKRPSTLSSPGVHVFFSA